MATTTMHSRGARTRTAAEPVGARIFERPVGAALTGLTALIVGAWGALAGYIGPYFSFRPVANDVWVNDWQNGLLHLLPGAVAAAAGLMLLAMGPARRSVRGGAFLLPGLLLVLAGAWFVIGPVAWPTFHSGPAFNPVPNANQSLLRIACASYAPGIVLAMLGGMALKAGLVPAVPVADPYTPAEAVPAVPREEAAAERRTVETEPTAASPTATAAAADSPSTAAAVDTPRTATTGAVDSPRTAATPGAVDARRSERRGFWRRRRA